MNNTGTLRIFFDLQACQTISSSHRGVGRYSKNFFNAFSEFCGPRELFGLLNSGLVDLEIGDVLPKSRLFRAPFSTHWSSKRDFQGGNQDSIDSLILSAFINSHKPDIIHVSHVFEGLNEKVILPNHSKKALGQIISATLYDLIPLRFQKYYFKNIEFKKWYLARLHWLRQADLLLSISEASKQDAIRLLGIDPSRIVTIYGGISPHFIPSPNYAKTRKYLKDKYKLKQRYILYTGGDDYRKNIQGVIKGFSLLPHDLRQDCQLVIACSIADSRKYMYLNSARKLGLAWDDLIFTGFLSEQDLVDFYSTCDLFVFPSLYEGLGLPILEAMACGAPVIGGDNSSIREIVGLQDALFDASSANSMAEKMFQGLNDVGFLNHLKEYGRQRVQDFSWKHTAEIAIQAFDEAFKRKHTLGIQAMIHGWSPRKRMAMLTPLPPCKSGIASFNAKFLPYLAQHFDIDLYVDNYKVSDPMLNACFRIYDASDFEAVANSYDIILYEIGNSEFHIHMLPLLEKYPGIVGLHDAYLSGLIHHIDTHCGNRGYFAQEVLYSHGTLGRWYLNKRDLKEAIIHLPCTKRILDQAIGLISHSPFNLEIARQFYPEGWLAPYRIISQMVEIPEELSSYERMLIRTSLGFTEDDFIICSFGHVVWTKKGDLLVEAFLKTALRENANVHLIFVGEMAKDEFGIRLFTLIKAAKIKKRIRVTGYLDEKHYLKFLCIADLAVQLRNHSRGGTPKGVLDCLAYGIPVIVNNDASYQDYPADVVIKLPANPSVDNLALTLEQLYLDKEKRVSYIQAGLDYLKKYHNPEYCAAEYAAVIHQFYNRDKYSKTSNTIPAIAPLLESCTDPTIQTCINSLVSLKRVNFIRRRLLIDVSFIAQFDYRTGIQRVVREIVKAMYCSDRAGFEPIAVELKQGYLRPALAWLKTLEILLPDGINNLPTEICFQPGDVFLMLDSSWQRYQEFFPIFDQARNAQVPIYTTVYDLLPLRMPGCFIEGGRELFTNWLEGATIASDGLVCISKSVVVDVIDWLNKKTNLRKKLRLGFWHLGSNLIANEISSAIPQTITDTIPKPYLFMVGTIEPRKSHALALAAMEYLWEQDCELCLCIAGKEGWMVSDLMQTLRNHPKNGTKLFLLENPSDPDLIKLYSKATALLFVSKDEGFGLPLVEAANYGIPIICSNIPIFHEIAGDYASYVSIDDPKLLAEQLKEWYSKYQLGLIKKTYNMPRLTWQESANMLLNVLFDNNWLKTWTGEDNVIHGRRKMQSCQ